MLSVLAPRPLLDNATTPSLITSLLWACKLLRETTLAPSAIEDLPGPQNK